MITPKGRDPNSSQSFKGWISILALMITLTSPALGQGQTIAHQTDTPAIRITQTPPAGGGDDRMGVIAGKVSGAIPENSRVVIYSFAAGTFFVQPFINAPYTEIGRGGQWQNRIHLGSHYIAMVVRAGYHPPARTAELPSMGGTILAVADAPPGLSEGGAGGALSFPALQLSLLIFIALLCLGAYGSHARQIVSSVSDLFGDLFAACRELFRRVWDHTTSWLKTAPEEPQAQAVTQRVLFRRIWDRAPSRSKETQTQAAPQTDEAQAATPQQSHDAQPRTARLDPLLVLKGLLAQPAAVVAIWGNFVILSSTLEYVFPDKAKVVLLASVFVALKLLIGMLYHALKGLWARFTLVCLGILLSLAEAYFAFQRTMMVEQIERLMRDLPDAPQSFSQAALSAAFVALLCALCEMVSVYAVFRLGGRALPWVVAAPGLLMVGILLSLSWLATKCQLATRLGACFQAVISILAGVGGVMLTALTVAGRAIFQALTAVSRAIFQALTAVSRAIFQALTSMLRAVWEFLKRLPRRVYEGWHTWRMNLRRRRLERDLLDLERRKQLEEREAELDHQARVNALKREREWLREKAESNELRVVVERSAAKPKAFTAIEGGAL